MNLPNVVGVWCVCVCVRSISLALQSRSHCVCSNNCFVAAIKVELCEYESEGTHLPIESWILQREEKNNNNTMFRHRHDTHSKQCVKNAKKWTTTTTTIHTRTHIHPKTSRNKGSTNVARFFLFLQYMFASCSVLVNHIRTLGTRAQATQLTTEIRPSTFVGQLILTRFS